MPLRIYGPDDNNNSDWRSPTEVRVYDNGSFRNVDVMYVYDTGTWKVVFPDPITPTISLYIGPVTTKNSVYAEFNLINADYIVVQLYAGTTQSTLLQSQTIDTNDTIVDRKAITFSGLSSDTTYNIKVTAYSITENTSVFLTGSFMTAPSITLTVTPYQNLTGALVSWSTTRQSEWRLIITRTSTGDEVYRTSLGLQPGTTNSVDAYFVALANTQYTASLSLGFVGGGFGGEDVTFTTPNVVQPSITNLSTTSTCNSITANWTGTNYTSASIELWEVFFSQPTAKWELSYRLSGPISYGTSPTSHTFTGLSSQTVYGLVLTLTSSTGTTVTSTSYLNNIWISSTQSASAPNAPTNFSGTSNFYGNGATLSWTAPTTNCSPVTGYNVQYKLSSSGTWLTLVNGITATSVNTTLYVTLTANRSYDFRVLATSSAGNSTYATTSLTTNNNPYKIVVYTLPLGTTTFNSVTVYGQLQNISSENVSNNGVSLSFSATAGRGSFSSTSASTNTSGLASVTYTTNSTTGNITFTVTGTGLVQGTYAMGVSLSPALTPSLSVTRNNFGYDVSHSNYNSSWSYSSSVTSPAFIWSGSVSSTAFGVYCPTNNTSAPTASQDANYVYCTTGSWQLQGGQITTTVNSSRVGYNNGSSSVTNNALGGFTAQYTYDWYYYNAQNVETYWGPGDAANNGRRGKGTIYQNSIKGRLLYCKVTAARNYSGSVTGANVANSSKITGT